MKAIVVREFGAPEVLKLEDAEEPRVAAGLVLVQVMAAGVNPVDTYVRSGQYGRRPSLPYTPGLDAGGIVLSAGEGVASVAPGDRVYVAGSITGTYAEKALCAESQVQPLPPAVSFAQGAAVFVPYATAWRALFVSGKAQPGETVLIHGASGGVGVAAVQLGRAHGLKVVGTAGTDRGRELVAREGAHHVLDHSSGDYLDKLLSLTGGRGPDVILEMLANVNLAKDLTVLAPRGRVVVIGSRGRVEIDPRDTMGRDASIVGMSLLNASQAELASTHAALVAGLTNGSLRPVVGQELPLAEAARAHEAVLEPGAYGKLVLIP